MFRMNSEPLWRLVRRSFRAKPEAAAGGVNRLSFQIVVSGKISYPHFDDVRTSNFVLVFHLGAVGDDLITARVDPPEFIAA